MWPEQMKVLGRGGEEPGPGGVEEGETEAERRGRGRGERAGLGLEGSGWPPGKWSLRA